ncbi:MAG: heparinase II/III family protein [Candidatus Poribacteria bacterium]
MLPVVACVALVLLASAPTSHAAYPDLRGRDEPTWEAMRPELVTIRREHPRIFMGAAGIEEVRERVASSPKVAETYAWLTEWADANHFYTNLWSTGNQSMAAAISYRLSGDPAHLAFALRIADFLVEAEGDSWTYPRIAKGLAFAYDWLYDDLTDEQRERYGKAAIRNAKACYDTWRHSDFNNHLYLEYGPVIYVGIALHGDGVDDEAAEQLALDGAYLLKHHMMPAHEFVGRGDGGWHESMSYHAFFTYELAHQMEAWQSATGDDLWSDFNGLDGEGAFQLYNTRPHDGGWVATADIGGRGSFSEANASYLSLTHRRRRDPLAGYWVDHLRDEAQRLKDGGRKYVRDGSSWWSYVLWHDPSAPVNAPPDVPTARLFAGVGYASMRSAWSPDATFAMFTCQPTWYGGHQHADNNSFEIHANGLLAVDSGVYDATAHRGNYYARTIAHNTVTVTDPNEQFGGATWGAGKPGSGANDGGQLYSRAPDLISDVTPDNPFARSAILAYRHTDEFTYVVGDATGSYRPEKLREFTRAFLFIHPSIFVVFDRVESTDASFTKRWLLHSATELHAMDDRAFQIDNGESKLTVRTLAPESVDRVVIGGEGREFETAGVNYPPRKKYDADEAGRWRVEVSPRTPRERDYFLHVLDVDGQTVTARIDESGDTVTAHIVSEGVEYAATFTKRGDLTGTLTITPLNGAGARGTTYALDAAVVR